MSDLRLYTIRHATLLDLSDLDRIEQECFSTPWSKELIRGAIYNSRYDVRVIQPREQSVLGFYIAHTVQRRSNLDNLAVDRRERQRGLGRRLIDDWIQRSRNQSLGSLTLQVNSLNLVAQTLYLNYGFRIQRLLRGYYTNGDDAYEMELPLEPCCAVPPNDPEPALRRAQGRQGS
jgi:ribosomal-protein-alanine N-acetyltransferase